MIAALSLAFGAGLVATINPCGFAMLPAYLSYFMGIQSEERSKAEALRSALIRIGLLRTAGVSRLSVSSLIVNTWLPR